MNSEREFEKQIGYQFRDPTLLEQALTHPSAVAEGMASLSNQRLEFLGDSVLDLLVSDRLFRENPKADEGKMTAARASLVCGPVLAEIADQFLFSESLRLGKTAKQNNIHHNKAALEDALEAIFGAAYLDGGLAAASQILDRLFEGRSLDVQSFVSGDENPKGTLQEKIQAISPDDRPEYEIVETEGPAHDRTYESTVHIGGELYGRGRGPSKKQAETEAARQALENFAKEQNH